MGLPGVKGFTSQGDFPVNFRTLLAGDKVTKRLGARLGARAGNLRRLAFLWRRRVGLWHVATAARAAEEPSTLSTVVEAWRVVSDQCLLSGRPCSPQRILAEMVHRRGWSDALGNVTTPVMALDEHPSRIVAGRRQPRVPDVGDEERNIARFGNEGYRTVAIPLQIAIGQSIEWRRLSRRMASRNDSRRARLERAVPQENMSRNGKDRVGDAWVPRNVGVSGDVWSGVDVPEPPQVLVVARWLPPGSVGDDVAVLAEERLDSPEDAWIADGALDEGTAVEHLVTERRHLPNVVVGISHIRRVLGKDPLHVRAEGLHGGGLKTPLSTVYPSDSRSFEAAGTLPVRGLRYPDDRVSTAPVCRTASAQTTEAWDPNPTVWQT